MQAVCMLTRSRWPAAGRVVFPSQHLDRWAFDVELLFVGRRRDIPISDVEVKWTEIEGRLTVFLRQRWCLSDVVT